MEVFCNNKTLFLFSVEPLFSALGVWLSVFSNFCSRVSPFSGNGEPESSAELQGGGGTASVFGRVCRVCSQGRHHVREEGRGAGWVLRVRHASDAGTRADGVCRRNHRKNRETGHASQTERVGDC